MRTDNSKSVISFPDKANCSPRHIYLYIVQLHCVQTLSDGVCQKEPRYLCTRPVLASDVYMFLLFSELPQKVSCKYPNKLLEYLLETRS